MIAWILSFV